MFQQWNKNIKYIYQLYDVSIYFNMAYFQERIEGYKISKNIRIKINFKMRESKQNSTTSLYWNINNWLQELIIIIIINYY